ncbi:MAG: hypothetical protein RLZZ70_674 [Candidatus Parcubacteria bacterium]|jgi:hypothetical protein
MEANQFKKEVDEYREDECEKVKKVLEEYEKDPNKSKKELGVSPRNPEDLELPLTEQEVANLRNFLDR